MPRYFFHTQIGDAVVSDPTGTDLRDPDQAWIMAHGTVLSMMDEPGHQARLIGACLMVMDADGEVIFELPFAEAMVALPTTKEPPRGSRD